MMSTPVRLTTFSRGAGCGCKIAPAVLEEILRSSVSQPVNSKLLVGNDSRDDAAVFDIGDGKGIISTADFFMPVVDDAFSFGQIAAANAISDVYAMGGKPLMAIAVLGWPVEAIPAEVARTVLEGARHTCNAAGIPLAGGHSIDSAEPIFGLSVTGMVAISHLKKNNTASEGDLIFLTKPLGSGILSTAQKREVISEAHAKSMISLMSSLNTIGEKLGSFDCVSAMTDVTGFGLMGHLIEMAEGSNLSATVWYDKLPVADGVREYLGKRIIPDATYRNWNSYSAKVAFDKGVNVMEAFNLLPDPQTNGGLLFGVHPSALDEVKKLLASEGFNLEAIGMFTARGEKTIRVSNQ